MISESSIGLIGIFLAIGGQYALLFQIYRMMGEFQIEIATCPWHRSGRKPAAAAGDE